MTDWVALATSFIRYTDLIEMMGQMREIARRQERKSNWLACSDAAWSIELGRGDMGDEMRQIPVVRGP